MRCKAVIYCSAAAVFLAASGASAQQPQSRILPAAAGAVAGVAGGGYIALSLVVLESRVGRYIHDVTDLLGWRSVPVIAGGITGAAIGAYDPDRLARTVLFGAAGLGVGAVLGYTIGDLTGETREARWAGAAIGGGFGLILGNLLGLLLPEDAGPGQVNVLEARVPVMVRIAF